MLDIKGNIFENYFKLSQKIQLFEQRLKSEDINHNARHGFHKELETIQGSLENLRKLAIETDARSKEFFAQLEELENRVIYLYRDIEERFEEHEISLISKEALEIGNSFEKENILNIANKIEALKHNIHFLFQHRRPSMQHRKIIHLSLQLANSVSETLQNKTSTQNFQTIALLLELLKKALLEASLTTSPADGVIAMELCEIAELYAQKKEHQGRSKLKEIRYLLNDTQKCQIDEAFAQNENMEKILLKLAGADDIIQGV